MCSDQNSLPVAMPNETLGSNHTVLLCLGQGSVLETETGYFKKKEELGASKIVGRFEVGA